MSETLHSLRGLDFVTGVRRSLQHLESLYGGNHGGNIPGIGEDLNEQIIEEVVFLQARGRGGGGGYSKKLPYVQELQLLEILIQYFKCQQNEWATNAIFRSLFGPTPLPPHRLSLLQKFISMAVGIGCASALNSAAVWMQVQGCGSDNVTRIAVTLVEDYCMLSPCSVLASLPDISSHFTCNFITAITHIYNPTEYRGRPQVPDALLKLFTDWLSERPQLCLFSLYNSQGAFLQPHRTNLWTSPTKPNTQTPIPGLVHWCTSAPLLNYTQQQQQQNNSRQKTCTNDASSPKHCTPLIWSQLHLSLLDCIVGFSNVPGAARLELLTLGDMNRIVKNVTNLIKDSTADTPRDIVEDSVDRMVQVLQVALATGGFRCSLADLKNIFAAIPESRLLQVLSQQHLSTAPPQMHNVRP